MNVILVMENQGHNKKPKKRNAFIQFASDSYHKVRRSVHFVTSIGGNLTLEALSSYLYITYKNNYHQQICNIMLIL